MHLPRREAETGPRIAMVDHPVRVELPGLALAKSCLAAAEMVSKRREVLRTAQKIRKETSIPMDFFPLAESEISQCAFARKASKMIRVFLQNFADDRPHSRVSSVCVWGRQVIP
jgi:hypothetical protein